MPTASDRLCILHELEIAALQAFLQDDTEHYDEIVDFYQAIASSRYISDRTPLPKSQDFLLNYLLSQPPLMFKQHLRTTFAGFQALVELLEPNPIFHSNSQCPQGAVAYQVAVCQMRLGSYGNDAALQNAQRTFGIGKGTVVLYTRRVIAALYSVRREWVRSPDTAHRVELSKVMEAEGFPGCLGFVNGTSLPLHQKPGDNGQAYYDRKNRYSIKLQVVCDADRRVTAFHFGWPGSAHDAAVYKDCALYKNPSTYFQLGQYILADSAYGSSGTVVPVYKAPASLRQDNAEFNYCVALARVRNEHSIGVLKGRWSSLRELRLPFNSQNDLMRVRDWVTACIVLHNMLAQLGDSWADLYEENETEEEGWAADPTVVAVLDGGMRESIKARTLEINYTRGVLPM